MTLKEQLALKPTITITLLRTEGMNNGAGLTARCGVFVSARNFTEAEYQALNDETLAFHINERITELFSLIEGAV